MFYETVIKPILESIDSNRDRNAFCINERFYSYKEFATTIANVAATLHEENIIGKNIGLVTNDDLETYASIFAIWMEGGAYVPLHPKQPLDRNVEIIQQAEIDLLLNSAPESFSTRIKTINSSELTKIESVMQLENIPDDFLAYILFTSGSTGVPKGVKISRRNLCAFIKSFWETGIGINENDRCLQCFDLTFDVSVQSYLAPLIKGACVYTIPLDQIKYSYVYGLLVDHKLTFGAMAPSMIRFLRPYFQEINAPFMRCNILTADASPVDLVNDWSQCIPNAEIYDFYGPTEATIYCTFYKYNRDGMNKQLNGMMSIGKPMNGIDAVIIDESGRIVERNQKGELYICGDQITPGYWKNQEKNKTSFLTLEYNGRQCRFYKTGDSCYMDDDGDIMLEGRLDHQVKIQGYRIELGEIEYHAREFARGQNILALTVKTELGEREVVLVIEEIEYNTIPLMGYLKSKLPNYMIPSTIKFVKPFPLNNNGKTDRIKLKDLL